MDLLQRMQEESIQPNPESSGYRLKQRLQLAQARKELVAQAVRLFRSIHLKPTAVTSGPPFSAAPSASSRFRPPRSFVGPARAANLGGNEPIAPLPQPAYVSSPEQMETETVYEAHVRDSDLHDSPSPCTEAPLELVEEAELFDSGDDRLRDALSTEIELTRHNLEVMATEGSVDDDTLDSLDESCLLMEVRSRP